jgi:NAD-dependent SIR2 family protein deacetylase
MTTITVLTGAGISVAAGIPSFRGKNGLYATDLAAADMFDRLKFMSKPKLRRKFWSFVRGMPDSRRIVC